MTTVGFGRPLGGPVSMRSAYLGRYTPKPIFQGFIQSWDTSWVGIPGPAPAQPHCVSAAPGRRVKAPIEKGFRPQAHRTAGFPRSFLLFARIQKQAKRLT